MYVYKKYIHIYIYIHIHTEIPLTTQHPPLATFYPLVGIRSLLIRFFLVLHAVWCQARCVGVGGLDDRNFLTGTCGTISISCPVHGPHMIGWCSNCEFTRGVTCFCFNWLGRMTCTYTNGMECVKRFSSNNNRNKSVGVLFSFSVRLIETRRDILYRNNKTMKFEWGTCTLTCRSRDNL